MCSPEALSNNGKYFSKAKEKTEPPCGNGPARELIHISFGLSLGFSLVPAGTSETIYSVPFARFQSLAISRKTKWG